jgi:hypothetical protein
MQIKTLIALNNICTLTDLRIAIPNLVSNAPVSSSDIYFDMPLSLRLEKSTLDDGAETYNLIVELEE